MILQPLRDLLQTMAEAVRDPRPRRSMTSLAVGMLCGEKPKTITSAIEWLGRDQEDWSSQYRFFSQSQWDRTALFDPILAEVLRCHPDPLAAFFFGQDDTLIRKTGKKIPGTAYARDPLSPPFNVNFVLGQRFLQTSFLTRSPHTFGPSRSLPVAFTHAPPLKAAGRRSEHQQVIIKELRKKSTLSHFAVIERNILRMRVDRNGYSDRKIVMAVDGSFANKIYLRDLPHDTTVVARIRKNAHLRKYLPPEERSGRRKYGEDLPTPEKVLSDDSIPFSTFKVYVAGEVRELKYKCIRSICWPQATLDKPLMLIVIKAAGYRLRKNSRLLYRQPAFLIVTDLGLPAEEVIEAYLARWEVEVNFREEKTTLGVGQAQVWNDKSVERAPVFLVACYSALLLTSEKVFGNERSAAFDPLPRWRNLLPKRPSLRDMIRLLRKECKQQTILSTQAA